MTLRLAWVAIAASATYLVFIGGGWLGIYSSPLRITTMVFATCTLGAWLFAARRSQHWRPRSHLSPAIITALGSLAVSTVFSRVPRVSLEYLGYAIVLAALYLLLVRLLAHPFFGRRLIVLGGLFFAVLSGLYVALIVGHWIDWWSLLHRFSIPPLRPTFEGLTYLNPSAVLTMTVLFAVPAAGLVDPRRTRDRWAILGIVVAIGIVAFLSGSRAGWLALALTTLLVIAGGLVSREPRAAIRRTITAFITHRGAAGLGAVLVIVTFVAMVAFAPAILRRLSEGGEDLRTQYAVTALRMFQASPIVGTGPGTWVIQRIATTRADEPDAYIPHAHNLEVQTLAEQGLVGALAGLVLVVFLIRLILGAVRDSDAHRRWFGWISFLGLAYFGLHQLLDFYANMPAALFAAGLPVAYLDATAPQPAPLACSGSVRRGWFRPAARACAIAVVAATLAGLLLQEIPAMTAARSVQLADAGDWAAADGPARDAASMDPEISSYVLTAGLTAARGGDHSSAAADFRRVAERDDLPEAWVNLAAEQLDLGASAEARKSIESAFRLGRQRPAIAVAVADLAIRLGVHDLAVDAVVAALRANPTLAADPWWGENAARMAVIDEASARLEASGPVDLRWQLALVRGDVAAAHTLAAGTANATFDALVIDAWADQEPAIELFSTACYGSPLDGTALTWCARVASHLSQSFWLADMRTLLEDLAPGYSDDAGEVYVDMNPNASARLGGGLQPIWGVFAYRRPVPHDLLVPGVAHLVLR